MKFTTIVILVLAAAVLFVAFSEVDASRRKLRQLKKLAALALLAKPKKLLAIPLPLPLPIPIPVIKKVESWPSWPAPSWPAPSWPAEPSWPSPPAESWPAEPSWA